jgi:hypothetical protein
VAQTRRAIDATTTGADGAFRLVSLEPRGYKLLVIGPDGTWTLAGMVNGDPATATEFEAPFTGELPWTLGT